MFFSFLPLPYWRPCMYPGHWRPAPGRSRQKQQACHWQMLWLYNQISLTLLSQYLSDKRYFHQQDVYVQRYSQIALACWAGYRWVQCIQKLAFLAEDYRQLYRLLFVCFVPAMLRLLRQASYLKQQAFQDWAICACWNHRRGKEYHQRLSLSTAHLSRKCWRSCQWMSHHVCH